MNKLTKKSFYSFLSLYLLSSFIFLSLASYWFYTAQVSMEMNSNYYKMNSIANQVSSDVIRAHMMKEELVLQNFENASVALFDADNELKYGSIMQEANFSKDYYMQGKTFTLVSQATAGHLGIKYAVIQSNECTQNVLKLKNKILFVTIIVAFIIIFISVALSYIFLKPIKEKMQAIEDFVRDTTHELNTPITALMMSTSRAINKKTYDERIMKNISISTKQLYDMYSALSFLSFDNASEKPQQIAFEEVVKNSIDYFDEILERKNIQVLFESTPCTLTIAPTKAKMLINNLLGNAIKYSHPNSEIKIKLSEKSFTIQDKGIGIAKNKLESIFKRFERANSYAGGFGIGLSIVESIIKEYGFKIMLESKENSGTSITLLF
ncbi:HAMP domain-containing histidine kinase [bacterium]|nr:HAMP domain-containing histidine kinase [bacterium]MBU1434241.1 HAMP domain-containing histidine kinase [bacterium]MBU1504336.1 HAMP domain-containing histidine kinase [bacterium]